MSGPLLDGETVDPTTVAHAGTSARAAAGIGRRRLMAATGLGVLAAERCRPTRPTPRTPTIRWLHLELNPKILKIWNDSAAEYQAAHPGVQVKLQFLENEAFKAKLPTLLQSPDAPSTFYSWGGGVMRAQADTGALRPIGAKMDKEWQARVNPPLSRRSGIRTRSGARRTRWR